MEGGGEAEVRLEVLEREERRDDALVMEGEGGEEGRRATEKSEAEELRVEEVEEGADEKDDEDEEEEENDDETEGGIVEGTAAEYGGEMEKVSVEIGGLSDEADDVRERRPASKGRED